MHWGGFLSLDLSASNKPYIPAFLRIQKNKVQRTVETGFLLISIITHIFCTITELPQLQNVTILHSRRKQTGN